MVAIGWGMDEYMALKPAFRGILGVAAAGAAGGAELALPPPPPPPAPLPPAAAAAAELPVGAPTA